MALWQAVVALTPPHLQCCCHFLAAKSHYQEKISIQKFCCRVYIVAINIPGAGPATTAALVGTQGLHCCHLPHHRISVPVDHELTTCTLPAAHIFGQPCLRQYSFLRSLEHRISHPVPDPASSEVYFKLHFLQSHHKFSTWGVPRH